MISVDEEIFKSFAFYGGILALKMVLMAPLTARQRIRKGAFANPEDATMNKSKVTTSDVDVERVRRAHLNDMENIFLYFFVAGLYMFTNPTKFVATTCFQVFTFARCFHTVVYLAQV